MHSPLTSVRLIAEITSYHAHIYYRPETRDTAAALRDAIDMRFPVRLGRWHDRAIGPHSRSMYQIAFSHALFPRFVPWLMLNHRGLNILIHANTRNQRRDHLEDALWIGTPLPLRGDVLPTESDPVDPVGEINSHAVPGLAI